METCSCPYTTLQTGVKHLFAQQANKTTKVFFTYCPGFIFPMLPCSKVLPPQVFPKPG